MEIGLYELLGKFGFAVDNDGLDSIMAATPVARCDGGDTRNRTKYLGGDTENQQGKFWNDSDTGPDSDNPKNINKEKKTLILLKRSKVLMEASLAQKETSMFDEEAELPENYKKAIKTSTLNNTKCFDEEMRWAHISF